MADQLQSPKQQWRMSMVLFPWTSSKQKQAGILTSSQQYSMGKQPHFSRKISVWFYCVIFFFKGFCRHWLQNGKLDAGRIFFFFFPFLLQCHLLLSNLDSRQMKMNSGQARLYLFLTAISSVEHAGGRMAHIVHSPPRAGKGCESQLLHGVKDPLYFTFLIGMFHSLMKE